MENDAFSELELEESLNEKISFCEYTKTYLIDILSKSLKNNLVEYIYLSKHDQQSILTISEKLNIHNIKKIMNTILRANEEVCSYIEIQNILYDIMQIDFDANKYFSKVNRTLFRNNPIEKFKQILYKFRNERIPVFGENHFTGTTDFIFLDSLLEYGGYYSIDDFCSLLENACDLRKMEDKLKEIHNLKATKKYDVSSISLKNSVEYEKIKKYEKFIIYANSYLNNSNDIDELEQLYDSYIYNLKKTKLLKIIIGDININDINMSKHLLDIINIYILRINNECKKIEVQLEKKYKNIYFSLSKDEQQKVEQFDVLEEKDEKVEDELNFLYQLIQKDTEILKLGFVEYNKKNNCSISEFEFLTMMRESIQKNRKKMIYILIKYPDLNKSEYKIDIELEKEKIKEKLNLSEDMDKLRKKLYKDYLEYNKTVALKQFSIGTFSEYLKRLPLTVEIIELIDIETEREALSHNIYSNYIKYLASLKNNKNAPSFITFAREFYKIGEMDVPLEYKTEYEEISNERRR